MKKHLLSVLALLLGFGMVYAGPVDVNRARLVGQQFAQNTIQTRGASLELVYAPVTERGNTPFYVFNIGQEAYVVVSGDDFYRPIIGYSSTHPYDPTDPILAYMLGTFERGRKAMTGEPLDVVKAEWDLIANEGRLLSKNGGRKVDYICQTKWNQNYPYNYYCPAYEGCPGGHFYVGCVATAMAQVMKCWNHPIQGQGSHTYTSPAHPITPTHIYYVPSTTCSANFGATTYDWDHMPASIYSGSPQVEIDAVATLMYHCAVAVDMDWDYDGSGSNSQRAAQRISQYFRYTSSATYQQRANYAASAWAQKVKESLDMGWPLLYSGKEPDAEFGHAFLLDGYDDNDLYHFNWGWSGSGDDWFTFETQDYSANDGAIFNFVPVDVYNSTPKAPTSFTITPTSETALSGTLTWTNPSKAMNNSDLSGIDYVVIRRGEEVIAILDNATPGATMSYVDTTVPRYDQFQYSIYAVTNGNHGKVLYSNMVGYGPKCNWTLLMSSTQPQGWRDGNITIHNAAGSLVGTYSTTSSTPSSIQAPVPLGHVSFVWNAPSEEIPSMTVIIKDAENQVVFNYTGTSADFPAGVFLRYNNGCGNAVGTGTPTNLLAVVDPENSSNVLVTWDGVEDAGYGYNLYRDGVHYRTLLEGTSFVDENLPLGGYCYYVSFLSYGGENENASNEYCVNAGEGCDSPYDLDWIQYGNLHKVRLLWSYPEDLENPTGFEIYRKKETETNFRMIKRVSATARAYTDNSLNQWGNYSYKVCAYYEEEDKNCVSAPAYLLYDHGKFQLDVYWSSTGVEESIEEQVSLYPNPNNGSFTVEGESLQQVMVFNTLGQLVHRSACEGNSTVINLNGVEPGFYMVKVITANGETVKKVSVMR